MKPPKILYAAIMALATPAAAVPPASAAVAPVIYNSGAGWYNPDVRPAQILIGQGGAPVAHTGHWSTWDKGEPDPHATAAGTLLVDSCIPDCAQGTVSYHPLTVTLSAVKTHDGVRYYSKMTWHTPGYRLPGYKTSTAVLHFSIPAGASSPGWH